MVVVRSVKMQNCHRSTFWVCLRASTNIPFVGTEEQRRALVAVDNFYGVVDGPVEPSSAHVSCHSRLTREHPLFTYTAFPPRTLFTLLASFKALKKPVTRQKRAATIAKELEGKVTLSSADRARRRAVKAQLTTWTVWVSSLVSIRLKVLNKSFASVDHILYGREGS